MMYKNELIEHEVESVYQKIKDYDLFPEKNPDWKPILPKSIDVVHKIVFGSTINGKTRKGVIDKTIELGYELAFEQSYSYRGQINEDNEFVRMVQWSSETFNRDGLLSHESTLSDTSGYLIDEFEKFSLWLKPKDKLAFELKWIPVDAK